MSDKTFIYKKAVLRGYSIRKNNYRPYPGLTKSTDGIAEGFIVLNIDRRTYKILKDWENTEYITRKVKVLQYGGLIKATTFVYNSSNLTNTDWDKSNFQQNYLLEFIHNEVPLPMQSKPF